MACGNVSDTNQMKRENITDTFIDTDTQSFILPMTFVGILSVFGCIGNFLVFIIFRKKKEKRTHTIFIIGLALTDLFVCSVTMPFEMYEIRNSFTFSSTYVCKIFRTYNYFVVLLSTFLLVFLSVDRYRRVCQPLKLQLTTNFAYVLIVVSVILSGCIAWPQWFLSGVIFIKDDSNTTWRQCLVSEDYIGTIYPAIFYNLILFIAVTNILIIGIIYSLIARVIVKHIRQRKIFLKKCSQNKALEMTVLNDNLAHVPSTERHNSQSFNGRVSVHGQDGSSLRITKIALTVSMFFVISYVPAVVLGFMEGVLGAQYTDRRSSSLGFIILMKRSFILNHVVNPFIYGFLDPSFRLKCEEMFKRHLMCAFCRQGN